MSQDILLEGISQNFRDARSRRSREKDNFGTFIVRQIYDIISACMPEECEFLKKSSGKCRKFFPATVCIVRMPYLCSQFFSRTPCGFSRKCGKGHHPETPKQTRNQVMKIGFDNEKYCRIQSQHIKERIAKFSGKLYLELGGKLFDDHHASRVLPGFQPDSKLSMLKQLADSAEIVIVISAVDIEKNKVRGDLGITYDEDVLRLRMEFQNRGFLVGSVVITHYNGQHSADLYRAKLERLGIKAYYHYTIEGYPTNVALIDSEEGFGKNDYVETERPLVIVTAPGPGAVTMTSGRSVAT